MRTPSYNQEDRYINISALMGKILAKVENQNDEAIVFTTVDGEEFQLWHEQDCCEQVTVEDICGELEDLVGSPILQAEENSSSEDWPKGVAKPAYGDSFTWTFYRLATNKGSVVIRWYGESNGYYSESVTFSRLGKKV